MLELIQDVSNLLATILVSCWEIIHSALNLVIIDDPFWRGVELTLIVLIIWNNRKELIQIIDRIPLLGGLMAKGLQLAESGAEYVLEKGHGLWFWARSNTWDRLVKLILKTDKDLRE